MPTLESIDRKLGELVRGQAARAAEAEPSEEERDEKRLREVEARIADLVDLLQQGATRDAADARIHDARARVASGAGEARPLLRVFHDHGGKRIPTTRRTQSKLQLAEALKLRLRASKHAQDLEHALHVLVREQVEILERQLGRSRGGAGI